MINLKKFKFYYYYFFLKIIKVTKKKLDLNFSYLALSVCDLWYLEDLEEKAHRLTDLIDQSRPPQELENGPRAIPYSKEKISERWKIM